MIHMNLNLSIFDCYLICINVIGFILFAINTWLYSHTDEKQIERTCCSDYSFSYIKGTYFK